MENIKNRYEKEAIVNYIKAILVTLAICVILTLFSLPIIFYYITNYTDYFTSQLNQTLGSTTLDNETLSQPSCDGIVDSWGIVYVEESDVGEEYHSESICSPHLKEWHKCLSNESKNLTIVPTEKKKTQHEIEKNILDLKNILDIAGPLFSELECSDRAIPFICHYYFPIIENNSILIQPTKEDCLDMENNVCRNIISEAKNRKENIPIKIPECNSLPEGNVTNLNSSLSDKILCKDDFILIGSKCLPRCDRFEISPHSVIKAKTFSERFTAALATTVSIICIILSIYNRRIMFKFPSIFMFYIFVEVLIIGILILITAFDRSSLMCSSVNLLEATLNPTTFCLITGAVWQYITVSLTLWWFIHLCIFFYMIMCPFHAKRSIELKKNQITVILTILGLVFPLPAVVVTGALDKYVLIDFPPSSCASDSTVWFYSTQIVICPLLGIGTSMLIMVIWKVHKEQFKRNAKGKKLTSAEKKLIFASLCYVIFGATVTLYLSVASGDQDKASNELIKYFNCESDGYVPGKCDRSGFERYVHTELQTIGNFSLGFLLFGKLNFVVSWRQLWKSIKNQFKRIIKK